MDLQNLSNDLLNNHSPGNRFVYYPPVSKWKNEEGTGKISLEEGPLTLYIHLPFCHKLCTFCGCNINLSGKLEIHLRYINAIIEEWNIISEEIPSLKERAKEFPLTLSLGGGTPSFLHPEACDLLFSFLKDQFLTPLEYGVTEAHPNSFSDGYFQKCQKIGIKAYSFGVQDFESSVCENLNRFEENGALKRSLDLIGEKGLKGIDLIWGLPKQREEIIEDLWKDKIQELSPDWISFYPLAPVPGLKTYQEAYGDFTLPSLKNKYRLYESGVRVFENLNYIHTGFGHFVKEGSTMHHWYKIGELNRLVSGLFPKKIENQIGLGVGALSFVGGHFSQNEKIIDRYLNDVLQKRIVPKKNHHFLSLKEREFLKVRDSLQKGLDAIPPQIREELLKLPKDWFHSQSISPYGLHFLKNILQTVENTIMEREESSLK